MRESWVRPWMEKIPWRREYPLQYSFLENPTVIGAWRAGSSPWGCKESTQLSDQHFYFSGIVSHIVHISGPLKLITSEHLYKFQTHKPYSEFNMSTIMMWHLYFQLSMFKIQLKLTLMFNFFTKNTHLCVLLTFFSQVTWT